MNATRPSRRHVLEVLTASVGISVLAACGGGSSEAATVAEPSDTGSPPVPVSPSPPSPPSSPPPAAPPPAPVVVDLPPLPPPVPAYSGAPSALERFAATVAPGAFAEFAAPSMADSSRTGSYPFDAPKAAVDANIGAVHLLDWATMMDFDTFTRRYYVSGGRPRTRNEPLKLVIYDEVANDWTSVDRWAPLAGCGHLYRSTTVMSELRLVAYLPSVGNAEGKGMIELWNIDEGKFFASMPNAPSTIGGFTNNWLGGTFICWFPTFGSKGSLVFANSSRSRVVRFDWASRTWLPVGNFDREWTNQHLNGHYHPVLNKMILGASTADAPARLAILSPDGSMVLTPTPCPVSMISSGQVGGPFVPHATKPLSILFERGTNRIWTYNWLTDTWVDRAPVPAPLATVNVIGLPHPSGGGVLLTEYGSAGTTRTYYWKPPAEWD